MGPAEPVLSESAAGGGEPAPVPPRHLTPLPPPRLTAGRALGETIQARGSTREFSGAAISAAELSTALYHATRGLPSDTPSGLVELSLSIHAVEGVAPGAYVYAPAPYALDLIQAGDVRRDSAFLCLDQDLGGSSSVTVFFLADLGRVLEGLGNRGYRVANLEAGVVGGRLYLGAYAQRFGATGLTFNKSASTSLCVSSPTRRPPSVTGRELMRSETISRPASSTGKIGAMVTTFRVTRRSGSPVAGAHEGHRFRARRSGRDDPLIEAARARWLR